MLQEHAFGVEWPNLNHKNWCLHCEKEFEGRSVRVLQVSGGGFYLECGTPGCDGSPIDWAPYPWWDPEHPVTIAYLQAHPEEAQHLVEIEDNADLDGLLPPPGSDEPCESNRLVASTSDYGFSDVPDASMSAPPKAPLFTEHQAFSPYAPGEQLPRFLPRFGTDSGMPIGSGSPDWAMPLIELENWLKDDQHYECSWDCFLQYFAGNAGFLASSLRVDYPQLSSAFEAILRRAFPQDQSTCQILIMQFAQTDLFHGAIHSENSLYLFYYLARIDYGFVCPTSVGAGKTVVARFRINQGG
ncbi:MAG: hypothetical protein JNN07_09705 [Verrucomicrobiales bacterium]|nr:hypothetical protein [Verrucomicrobiales bacterium]